MAVCCTERVGGVCGYGGDAGGNEFHEENSTSYPDAEKAGYSSENRCNFGIKQIKNWKKMCCLEQNCGCFNL